MARQSYTQLTIGGGEVRHPPPLPSLQCPGCDRWIKLTRTGLIKQHQEHVRGPQCCFSGVRPR